MSFLCWLMLTVTELNQSLTYIVIICTHVPHPSQSQINCLGMIYQSRLSTRQQSTMLEIMSTQKVGQLPYPILFMSNDCIAG